MRTLTIDDIGQTMEDYPYWILARELTKSLGIQGVIEYPTFPQQDRYRELLWKDECYGEDPYHFEPLTLAEKVEYKKLWQLQNTYSNQLNELHKKATTALKTMMTQYNIIPPENITPKVLTTNGETLETWEKILHGSASRVNQNE